MPYGNQLYHYNKDMHLSTTQLLTAKQELAQFILIMQVNGVFAEALTTTAQYLGINYRHLQRVVADFCDNGILVRANGKYFVRNQKALESIVSQTETGAKADKGFLQFL